MIPRHEDLGRPCGGFREHGSISGLEMAVALAGLGCDDDRLTPKERYDCLDGGGGEPELAAQDVLEFSEYRVANDEIVLGQDRLEEIGTKPTRGQCADDHVGVQRNSQDTSRNTSSSVR